jgi:hypothetical protein
MAVDLVNQCQKAICPLALAQMNLVNLNGLDSFQLPVRQTPPHEPFFFPK